MGNISPEKLKGCRLRKGWTLQAMAEEMTRAGHKISKAALGQFEKGSSYPKATTLRSIAKVFATRPSELMDSDFKLDFIGFRSLASLSQTKRESIKATMSWRGEKREELCYRSGYSRKKWTVEPHRVDVVEQADEIALSVRMAWGLGSDSIGNLTDVIERNGGEPLELESDRGFSGLSAWSNQGVPYLAVQKRDKDGARQRMDLAHELAHLVFDVDSPVDEEQFAHRFAGAFLLPTEVVVSELGKRRRDLNFQELKALKRKYGVSIQAWVRRAKDCAVISEATYKSLSFRIGRAGLRADEGDPYVKPEKMDRDLRLAARCVTEGVMGLEEAAKLAGLRVEELDDSAMMKEKRPKTNVRTMSREDRRKLAATGAMLAAAAYRESPEDLLPDTAELHED